MQKLLPSFAILTAALLCLSSAKPSPGQATPSKQFITPQHLSVAPTSPPGPDFNGDGIPDKYIAQPAVVNCDFDHNCTPVTPAYLIVYLGKGDGTFQAPLYTNLGYYDGIAFSTVFDINGDGKPDLAVSFYYGQYNANSFFLINDGKGNFHDSGKPGLGPLLATGDFNGDGKQDVINPTGIFYGAGDGTFTQAVSFAPNRANSAAAGDFDQDARLDIAIGTGVGIYVLYGKGNGQYDPPKKIADHSASELVVADLNHDGYPDLLATKDPGSSVMVQSLNVYTNLHNRTFSYPRIYDTNLLNGYFFTGDFNGDGLLDVSDGNYVTYGHPGGSFNAPVLTLPPSGSYFPITLSSVVPSVGDFNRDGIDDVAVLYPGKDIVAVYPGSGKGYLKKPLKYGTGYAGKFPVHPDVIATGDVNGDGILDIVTANNYSSGLPRAISVLLGNADGTFRSPIITPVPGSLAPSNVLDLQAYLVDVNHDGKADLIDVSGIALSNGDGTFGPTTPFPAAIQTVSGIAVGDFNRDGNVDIVVGQNNYSQSNPNTRSVIYTLVGDGKGGFTISHQEQVSSGGAVLTSLTVADMNGDGIPDLIYNYYLNSNNSRVVVELGDGNGHFGQAISRDVPHEEASSLLVADFNRDGQMDVVVLAKSFTAGAPARQCLLLLGSATGALSEPQYFPLWTNSGAVIDLNGDGAPDFVVNAANDEQGIESVLNTGAR